ncbi:MAG: CinA family protein [Pseudomonadota bacterium]|nr:CinA family protein [Pseudomonadota bacterium]MEC9392294.1 CinA family protein [Pseudomonadota bacterium]MEC9459363.1 CinA family protein [Pseudomonadota bacterium]|tara:strand:- start:248 stop:733 length:486 start_codon:yes stop_codon:yes gene_type:complete
MNETLIKKQTEEVIKKCKKKGYLIATAESCTGGMAASYLTSISGSSEIFDRGFITYSNLSKVELLGIDEGLINKYGAVSSETAIAMALGAVSNSRANISVSITGVAGPSGGTDMNPVGTVYIAIANNNKTNYNKFSFENQGRNFIRQSAVYEALRMIYLNI